MKKIQPNLRAGVPARRSKYIAASFGAIFFVIILIATLLPVRLYAQALAAPAISYSSPQTYTYGSPISALTPANTGGAVAAPAYASGPTSLTFGTNSQYFVAVDATGNVYTTNLDGTSITKYPVGNYGNYVAIGSGFVNPTGIAVDAAGNLYVADAGTGMLEKIPAGSNTPVMISSGYGNPQGVAVDVLGNVYVADAGAGTVFEIGANNETGGIGIALYTGLDYPGGNIQGIAVDPALNIYVTNPGMNWIMKMTQGPGAIYTYALTGLNGPYGIAIDAESNLFVVNTGGQIQEVTAPLTGASVPVNITAFLQPFGIAVDGVGNLYMTGTHSNQLWEESPVGGYYLNTALPRGLSFNNTTGVISGTPTVPASPAANYTVSAYNGSGGGSATVNITVQQFQILYNTPVVYTAGTAISPLAPTGAGVAANGYSSTPVTIGSGFADPIGVAVDGGDNVYVADNTHNAIKVIPAGNGTPYAIGSGINSPLGVAVDAAGNVYVSNHGDATVKKIAANNGPTTTIASGFSNLRGVAVDGQGNVYATDSNGNNVTEIPVGGGAPYTIGTGISSPDGIAADAIGNVYVIGTGNSEVFEITAGSRNTNPLYTFDNQSNGLAVDFSGNIFIASSYTNQVLEISSGGSVAASIGSGYDEPYGLAVDNLGNLYIGDEVNNAVKEISPVGGYYLTSLLPQGLSFSNTTGIISGTPTAATPEPTLGYVVDAYNSGGATAAHLNITVLPFTFSYNSPQVYTAGTTISALSPLNNGAAAPYAYSKVSTAIGSGFLNPKGVAVDASGNVYVADNGNNAIKVIAAGTGAISTIGTGISNPLGVAVDAAGNVYVANNGDETVKKIAAGNGPTTTIASGFTNLQGVAVDGQGNVYASDHAVNNVTEIPVGGGPSFSIGSGIVSPEGICADAAGNVYVIGTDYIPTLIAAGTRITTQEPAYNIFSIGIAVDASGNLFYAAVNPSTINETLALNSSVAITIGSGFNQPFGLAVDGAGNLYVGDSGNNAVEKISPVGGYYINSLLPAGLIFDNTTGIISGTPAAGNPATNYTVTAYISSGATSATVNIKVQPFTISYASPQIYGAGIAASPLAPTGSAAAAYAYTSGSALIYGSFNSPLGVAVDASGNVYVADNGNNAIKVISASTGTISTIGTGINNPIGVAVDAAGNVYVANSGENTVRKIAAGNGPTSIIASGFTSLQGVSVDGKGNVYASDAAVNNVTEIPVGGGTPFIIGTGISSPTGISADAAGDVYVIATNNTVFEIAAGSRNTTPLATFGNEPVGLAVDVSGNIFVSSPTFSQVLEVTAVGFNTVAINSVFGTPYGLAVDWAGNLYVGNSGSDVIRKIPPAGGYFLNASLPAGLSFSNVTGIISGTPTVKNPAANYTVTAYKWPASSTTTVNITVTSTVPTISYSSPPIYGQGTLITPLAPTSSNVAAPAYSSTPVVIGTGFSGPTGVAADAAGDVFIADYGNKLVKKIPAGSNTPTAIGSGFTNPFGVAVDAAGDVYVADYGASAVYKIPAGNGTPVTIG